MAEPKDLRIPPQNIDAEQSVLGALLLDKDAIIKVADMISPDDFYRPEHAKVYSAMLTLFEKHIPIDLVTLSNILEKEKSLKDVGGTAYLTELVNSVPTAAHVVKYAEIVQDKATLRRLLSVAAGIEEKVFGEEDDVDTVLDSAERSLFSVSQKFVKQYFTPIKDILASTFDRIDELHKHKGKIRGVATGFHDLDNLLGGLQPSDLIIIAARPSMGKSSLAIAIAANAAIRVKIPTALFSLEMSRDQLVDRLISMEAQVDAWKLRTGNLSEEDFPKIGYAMGVLSEAPIFIDDSPIANVLEIRTKARRLQAEKGLGLIIVDYLQLMEGKKRAGDVNRVQEISEISRGLKALARELNVPVIACSQLSRAVEQRSPKIPQLADLRESGSIEQDADVVAFIYRDEYYDPDTDRKGMADIYVKKHRHGPTGQIELYFVADQMNFRSIEKKREPEPAPAETRKR
jgi:replicative DNA helicase